MAQSPSYLQFRSSSFYFRLRVPDLLRPVMQRRELVVSLRTANRRQALRLSHRLSDRCRSLFDWLMTNPLKLDPQRITQWLREMVEAALQEDEQERLTRSSLGDLEHEYDILDHRIDDLYEQIRDQDWRQARPIVDTMLKELGVKIDSASTEYRQLCRRTLQAQIHKPPFASTGLVGTTISRSNYYLNTTHKIPLPFCPTWISPRMRSLRR